ncbi:MAG TPA: hypothetical protein VN047_19370 [Sphingopyxis sp.]|nr:hypothetical protein [Sphingopyxis sp.]HWW59064.1 hypothetical protein [Sphingopyxis sp.]
MKIAKCAERGGKEDAADRRQGGDAELSAAQLRIVACLSDCAIDLGEDALAGAQEFAADRREIDGARRAVDEFDPQIFLKLRDKSAERRLRKPDGIGRAGEAPMMRHRAKGAQMLEIDSLATDHCARIRPHN